MTARIEVAELAGTIADQPIPSQVSPVTMDLDGLVDVRNGIVWRGRSLLTTAALGQLATDGTVSSGATGLALERVQPAVASVSPPVGQKERVRRDDPKPRVGGSGTSDSAANRMAGEPTANRSAGARPQVGAPAIDLRWTWKGLEVATLASLGRSMNLGVPESLDVAGAAEGRGTVAGTLDAPRLEGTFDVSSLRASMVAAAGNEGARLPSKEQGAPGGTSAPGAKDVTSREPQTPGRSSNPGGRDRASQVWALREGSLHASLAWSAGRARPIEIGSLTGTGQAAIQTLPPVHATWSIRGSVDPSRGTVAIDEAKVDATDLLHAQIEGAGALFAPPSAGSSSARTQKASTQPPSPAERGRGKIKLTGIDLPRWQSYLRPLTGDLAPGYEVKGKGEADLAAMLSWDGGWMASGKAAIGESGFSSEDGAHVLQGLDTTWDVQVSSASMTDSPIEVHATATVGGFQVLWGSIFADDSQLTSTLELTGTLASLSGGSGVPTGPGRALPAWSVHAIWMLPDGPRIDATLGSAATAASSGAPAPVAQRRDAEIAPGTLTLVAYEVAIQVDDLGAMARTYLRPFGDSLPLFQKVEAAGSAHIDAAGTFSAGAQSLRGRLRLNRMRLTGTQQVAEIEGLDLDLPVDLHIEKADEASRTTAASRLRVSGEPQQGSLRFQSATLRGLKIPATSTQLLVRADSVELKEALVVPLLGGELTLQELTLAEGFSPTRHAEAAIQVSRVSLEEITRAFGSIPLEGSLDADFPRVRLSGNELQVQGGGQTRIFGGVVKFGDISGQDILSSYPKITVSAEFTDIDLGQVTRKIDFGEMTGLVNGYVRQCELFGGVPVAFVGQIETSDTSGPSRTVNVKAIKNLTVLGTGTQANIFDRGIQRFFDKYTYSRIGVHVELHSDELVLRGLEHSGDKELFIKGRLPFPINVVNAQPGTAVSFQDMVERLRSLDIGSAKVTR